MDTIKQLGSIAQFNSERGQETLHPLVTVLDQSKSKQIKPERFMSSLYLIFLKDTKCAEIKYGRSHYDYQDDTIIFIAPGQLAGIEDDNDLVQPNGWALAFHPDLIKGTALGRQIKKYTFFSYEANEALHPSEREKQMVLESFHKIKYELEHAIDKHSRALIVSNIELLLNYCIRFYDRQFITRDHVNRDILVRLEALVDDYFQSDKPQTFGLPSVAYFAGQFNLSSNYFGDLIKKETGRSAHDYILEKLIEVAKIRVYDTSKTIGEIAYEMGFKYPAHFTRLFKQKVGQSPNEYRLLN